MNFIKSHWKLLLIAVGALIVLVYVGSVTGTNSKLYNILVDQLRDDQSKVVKVQAENQKWYEDTIKTLQDKLDEKGKQLEAVDVRLAQANKTINNKDAEIFALRRERDSIITSSDPNSIINDLIKLGYGTEHRRAR